MTTANDVAAIANSLGHLAHAGDSGTLDAYVSSFTPDGQFVLPMQPDPVAGRDAIRGMADQVRQSGGVGPGSNTRHVVTTVSVDVDGDTASSVAVFQMFTDTTTKPTMAAIGRYLDNWRREDGEWLVGRREIVVG
jgi:uncharacterized protein (TIGR02246 family)